MLICILLSFGAVACEQGNYNAYTVSSELRSVPIIESNTGQTIGQAYNGFAVSINEVRNQKAYFELNISDPSIPTQTEKIELYIPIEYMKKANVEEQITPPIISLDVIYINPTAGISLFMEGQQQVIAMFYDEIGPVQFIQNVQNGYLFTLGMNLVYVDELDVKLIKYDD